MSRVCTALLLLLLLPSPAAARAKRPEQPPLPRPLPQIIYGHCPGLEEAAGCYLGNAIYVLDRHSRFAKLHEVGHAYDELMMDAGERNRFARLIGKNDLLWTWSDVDEEGRLIQGWGTPAETFADAYANCRMGHVPGATIMESGYDYYPTVRQHRRICGVITRAGRDLGAPVSADGER